MRSGASIFAISMCVGACGGRLEATSAPPAIDAGVTSSDGEAPDAAADAPSPDAGPVVHGPVRLVEIIPADGALHVAPLTTVKLRYSGSLDASSVTNASVRLLRPNATIAMHADVTYDDATYTITLTPKTVLAIADLHRIAASGLRAADETPLPDVASSFTTVYDTTVDTGVTTSGYLSWSCLRDALGRSSRCTGVYTGTNKINSYTTFAYKTPTGIGTLRNVFHNDAGPDGVWYTADDGIYQYVDHDTSVFGRTRIVGYSSPGPDMIWQTADDPPWFGESDLNAEGLESSFVQYSSPGPDRMPFTADDVIQGRSTTTWTATSARNVSYGDPGPDKIWNTSDDLVSHVTDFLRDAVGRVTATLVRDPGPDGKWLTPDDPIHWLNTNVYDAKGLLLEEREYATPGPDGVWFTADDGVYLYAASTYDVAGAMVSRSGYNSAGPDGIWFTEDDVAWELEHHDPTK
jgi:hypothetical protein